MGNLDPNVSESLILELFSVIGPCKSCKMIPDVRILLCFMKIPLQLNVDCKIFILFG